MIKIYWEATARRFLILGNLMMKKNFKLKICSLAVIVLLVPVFVFAAKIQKRSNDSAGSGQKCFNNACGKKS